MSVAALASAVCLLLGQSSPSGDGAARVDAWAAQLLERSNNPAIIATATRSVEAAMTLGKSRQELPPWEQALRVDYTSLAGATVNPLALSPEGMLTLDLATSKYLGFGSDVSLDLSGGYTTFAESPAIPIDSAWDLRLDFTAGIDLWQDRFGRYREAQRESAAAASFANAFSAQDDALRRIETLLGYGLDYCVQVKLDTQTSSILEAVRELLEQVELKGKARLIRQSDLLQFRSLVHSLERNLVSIRDNRRVFQETLQRTYNVVLDPKDCPTLDAGGEDLYAPALARAPRLLSAEAQVESRENELLVSDLAQQPVIRPFAGIAGISRDPELGRTAELLFSDGQSWGYVVGITANWPLGDGRGELLEQATASFLRASREARQAEEQLLTTEATTVAVQLENIQRLLDILSSQEKVTEEYLTIERSRYQIGNTSAFVLSAAYQEHLNVITARPRLEASWHKGRWRLHALDGTLAQQLGYGN